MSNSTAPRKRGRLSQEDRRAQLLKCALKVFAEHGLDGGNHALIAKEAQVSVPTVFFYFSTREKLVDAVLTEVEQNYKKHIKKVRESKDPAIKVLLGFDKAMFDTMKDYPYNSRIFLEWSIMARADIWPRFLKFHKLIIKTLSTLIKRGQAEGSFRPELVPEDEAYILHASSYSISQMKLTGMGPTKLKSYRKSILQTVLLPGHPDNPFTNGSEGDS
jgi:TetR/AcrR family hemagglutinin/protease transcriptional regulator